LKRVLPEKEDPSLPPKTNPVTAFCGNGIFYARLLLVSGTGFGVLVLRHCIQGIGFWAPFSGHRSLGVALWTSHSRHRYPGIGFWAFVSKRW